MVEYRRKLYFQTEFQSLIINEKKVNVAENISPGNRFRKSRSKDYEYLYFNRTKNKTLNFKRLYQIKATSFLTNHHYKFNQVGKNAW